MDDLDRWRLVLGKYAHEQLGESTDDAERAREEALDFLYQREYAGRDVRGMDLRRGRRRSWWPGGS